MGQLIATLKPKSHHVEWPPPLCSYPSDSIVESPRTEKTIATGPKGDVSPWRCPDNDGTDDPSSTRLSWPYEVRKDHEGHAYVMDHMNLITTWEDPVRASGFSGYLNGGRFAVGQKDVDRAIAGMNRAGRGAWSGASTLKDDETEEKLLAITAGCMIAEEVTCAALHTSTGT